MAVFNIEYFIVIVLLYFVFFLKKERERKFADFYSFILDQRKLTDDVILGPLQPRFELKFSFYTFFQIYR